MPDIPWLNYAIVVGGLLVLVAMLRKYRVIELNSLFLTVKATDPKPPKQKRRRKPPE